MMREDRITMVQNRVGQQFGNYRLTAQIGSGGYADVYLAEHLYISDLQHAIKVLKGTDLEEYNQEEFLLEARTIANLQRFSSHIVQISDVGIQISKEAGATTYTPYIIMEYASCGTLRGLYPYGTRVPLERIVFYTNQIAEALQCAHDQKSPIIHRDVKPENMLLRTLDHVLLSDFGISISGKTGTLKVANERGVVGTAAYIAPERFSSHMRRASDQYSLGIVVYEWICGEHPFDGTDREICRKHLTMLPPPLYPTYSHVTLELEKVIQRALQKNPEDRYPTVQAFVQALEKAITAATRASPPAMFLPATQPAGSQPADKGKITAALSMSQTLQAPPASEETTLKMLHVPVVPSPGIQQAGIVVPAHMSSTTEPFSSPQAPPAGSAFASSVRGPLKKERNFFEFSSQFAFDQQNSFFLYAGQVLNVFSALALGLLLRNLFVLFGCLVVSWLLFTLCVRAVEEKLALFFGIVLAGYWGGVGYVIGGFLASQLNLKPLLPSLFVGGIFLLVSLFLHIQYVSKKNL